MVFIVLLTRRKGRTTARKRKNKKDVKNKPTKT
jgi:hypothetical protein